MIANRAGICLSFATVWTVAASAQLPTADLARIEPRVAKVGCQTQIKLHGKHLDQVRELQFTHPGITAEPLWQPATKLLPKRPVDLTFDVHVGEDVPAGIYEVRAAGYFGLSTARPIVVVDADSLEVPEAANNTSHDTAMPVELNSAVHGSVASRGVDWFQFNARAGQAIVIEVIAERIDSRLDSQLVLYDSDGNEVARNRDYFGRDSLLKIKSDQDCVFYLSLSDILFRGGSEHFYRLRIHTQPHVDYAFPPAIQPGATQRVDLYGLNLPGETASAEIQMPTTASLAAGYFSGQPRQGVLPTFPYPYAGAEQVRIGFATAPVVIEATEQSVQEVSVPVEIAGRFDQANDDDTFRFLGKSGETYCLEVIADRMGFPVDPMLIVQRIEVDEQGQESLVAVTENDDMPSFFSVDGKDSINADTCDAACQFQADQDATYQVTIINQFGDGGSGHLYRLAIRPPTPDFQLIATTEQPLATNRTGYSVTPHLRRGAKWGIRILCPRQDDFEGEITVSAEGLPMGVTAEPLVLSGKADQGVLVVSADMDAESWAGDFQIVGRYQAGDRVLVREAKFAALVWGHIFADSIRVRSRLTERIPLSVNSFELAPATISVNQPREWTVEIGKELEVPLRVTNTGGRSGNLTIEPRGLFGLLRSPPTVNVTEDQTYATLKISFQPNGNFKLTPGRYQFALHGTGVAKYRENVRAHQQAEEEEKRLVSIHSQLTADLEAANQQLQDAEGNLKKLQEANAAAGNAAESEQPEIAVASNAVEKSKMSVDELNAQLKELEKVRVEQAKLLKAAAATAAEKNTNFAAWSDLITVTVVDPAKE